MYTWNAKEVHFGTFYLPQLLQSGAAKGGRKQDEGLHRVGQS